MDLTHLSNEEVSAEIVAMHGTERSIVARMVRYLAEVEERRIHLEAACPSLFDYCIRRVGLSEGEAFRRMTASRLVRKFPDLLGRLERGELHLSALVLLRDRLNEASYHELVTEASGKSKREIQELLARRAPKPDVPAMIRKFPEPAPAPKPLTQAPMQMHVQPAARPAPPPSSIEPLSESRYKVQFTASTKLREKIGRAADLMRHRNPNGDLEVLAEAAFDLLLEKLEKERLGKTTRNVKAKPTTDDDHIPAAVRREVFARDGERCTYRDAQGNRCPCTTLLELDHVVPLAMGGKSVASNLRVVCRPHNRLHAEQAFGKDYVGAAIHLRQRKLELKEPPGPFVYVRQDGPALGTHAVRQPVMPRLACAARYAMRSLANGAREGSSTAEVFERLRPREACVIRSRRRHDPTGWHGPRYALGACGAWCGPSSSFR